MKIAVTYDNGEVFQHFGHSEFFKIYEVENDAVVSSQVIGSEGQGHGALAELLSNNEINVVICGGIGGGAINALSASGIEVCSGISGNTDEAVEAYLKGELVSQGVNCDHHHNDHEEGEDGGCHCGGHEGGEEGGCHCGDGEEGGGCHCGGGCHAPSFEGPNVGKKVKTHYRGTLNDGTVFDSSYDRGEPLEFICGAGQMILGYDKAVATMNVGDKINVHLMPDEAYGYADPSYIFTVDLDQLPGSEALNVGEHVYLQDNMGRPFPVTVYAKTDVNITFDANHEMAGKELNFEIELVSVED